VPLVLGLQKQHHYDVRRVWKAGSEYYRRLALAGAVRKKHSTLAWQATLTDVGCKSELVKTQDSRRRTLL
jgi:hypothetical protein